jgi:hypothetical protein
VFVHPLASVPVTVYVVLPEGKSVTGEPVSDPGIHVYVAAPEPVSVTPSPLQIVVCTDDALTVGFALTETVSVDVLVQPPASVPVTV